MIDKISPLKSVTVGFDCITENIYSQLEDKMRKGWGTVADGDSRKAIKSMFQYICKKKFCF